MVSLAPTSIRVLVVDDSPSVRFALKHHLEKDHGIRVVGTAENGAEGLAKIAELDPDVVTLDIEMPVMDGLEVLRRIMRERPRPVVIVSSKAGESCPEAAEVRALGACALVEKPSVRGADVARIAGQLIYRIRLAHACAPRPRRG